MSLSGVLQHECEVVYSEYISVSKSDMIVALVSSIVLEAYKSDTIVECTKKYLNQIWFYFVEYRTQNRDVCLYQIWLHSIVLAVGA